MWDEAEEQSPQDELKIETVSIDEAKALLTDYLQSIKSMGLEKSGKAPFVTFDIDGITQEDILNRSELMTVVPAKLVKSNQFCRVLLLRVDNKLQKSVFIMYPEGDTKDSRLFTGTIVISELDGTFRVGYKCKEGLITHYYISKKNKRDKNLKSACATDPIIEGGTIPVDVNIVATAPIPGENRISINYIGFSGYPLPSGNSYGCQICQSDAAFWDFGEGGGSATSLEIIKDPFVEDMEKINMDSPSLLQEISCLIRNILKDQTPVFTTDYIEGGNIAGTSSYEIGSRDITHNGHRVKIVVVYDPRNKTNHVGFDDETHLGNVVYYEIYVKARINTAREKPNLIRILFDKNDVDFAKSVWQHIKGEKTLWECD